jgi:hypothetical protein
MYLLPTPKSRGAVESFVRIRILNAKQITMLHVPIPKYRVVVGGSGMVYEGESLSEAKRQFTRFVLQSKTAGSKSAGETVTLFKKL